MLKVKLVNIYVVIAICLVLGIALVINQGGAQVVAQKTCEPFNKLTPEEQEACIKEKAERFDRGILEEGPYTELPFDAETATPIMDSTPLPLGFIPEEAKVVYEVSGDDRVDGPVFLRPQAAVSVWQVGAVSSTDLTFYYSVIIYSVKNTCALGSTINNDGLDPDVGKKYNKLWTCPDTLGGELTIVSVTGPEGIINFTSSKGITGSLNITTDQWVFERE
jgi:hypothetical protein